MEFNDNFLRACRKQSVDHIPVWFMRQAGRYQPEYREIRTKNSLMDIVRNPELCAKVTKLPVEQLGVDAAILFSDIMTPVEPMGVPFEIKKGFGPYLENPIRTAEDVKRISMTDFEQSLPHVKETIQQLNDELNVPLIGFCGAPYTLSSYLIEGGKSKNYLHMKQMMYAEDGVWDSLMTIITDGMIQYLNFQVKSGARALQVFDSWVGHLSVKDYKQYVFPYVQRLFDELRGLVDVPLIYFGLNTYHLFPIIKQLDVDVIGIDYRITFPDAKKVIGDKFALQGNIHPTTVFAPWNKTEEQIDQIIQEMEELGRTGFIFNLGHGVIPQTDGAILRKIVDRVHTKTSKSILQH